MSFRVEKNRIRGLKAKRAGDSWENVFESSAWRAGCKVIKIPSGCRWVAANRAVAVPTPFDFVIMKAGKSIYLDTKSTMDANWTYSMNDPQQLHWLGECAQAGHKAGYVVNFQSIRKVVFFSIYLLAGLRPRESLKPEQGYQLSGDDDRLNLGGLFYVNEASPEIDIPNTIPSRNIRA